MCVKINNKESFFNAFPFENSYYCIMSFSFDAAASKLNTIPSFCIILYYHHALYRENAIAIESDARDSNVGNVYFVTMQITFPFLEVVTYCTLPPNVWVSRLVLGHAIAAIQTSRQRPILY